MAKRTQEELEDLLLPGVYEKEIQRHINKTVQELGYDDENSIAKYLVVGNHFFEECSAISLWIGSVWVSSHIILADVLAGTLSKPTENELIAMLPTLNLGEEDE